MVRVVGEWWCKKVCICMEGCNLVSDGVWCKRMYGDVCYMSGGEWWCEIACGDACYMSDSEL